MTIHTPADLENQMIYSVLVRNHTPQGTLKAVEADLDRIQALGTDILWLLPVQPSGLKERKGKDGSPYAIRDYRAISSDYGTWKDLEDLHQACQKRGMKLIVDVVYNHTSPDSKLASAHPEWFYLDENGKPGTLHKDWSDIIDLDYSHPELRDYQIETLKWFAACTDGFRCDVASRVPVSFWKEARTACDSVHPGLFWLAESCHLPFIKFVRDHGRPGESDSALFDAFDALYDYDAFPELENVFRNQGPISRWSEALERQESTLPENYIKTRYLENHDTDRIGQHIKEDHLWKNWIAMQFALKGMPMIYHGQEYRSAHRPSIFDKDVIERSGDKIASEWIALNARLHKTLFKPHSPIDYIPLDEQGVLIIQRPGYTGVYQLQEKGADQIAVPLKDGEVVNLYTGSPVRIENGKISVQSLPVLFKTDDQN